MPSPKPIIPTGAESIAVRADGTLEVPDRPIIPFIEGDGTGPDIWRASVRVLDAAVVGTTHGAFDGAVNAGDRDVFITRLRFR